MKTKLIPLLLFGFLFSHKDYCQVAARSFHPKLDSFYHLKKQNTRQINISKNNNSSENSVSSTRQLISGALSTQNTLQPENKPAHSVQRHTMYRDTRLGSSSKMYDTYEKNDYGAGAITTNPDK